MPQYDQQTYTAPGRYSDILAGAGHHAIVDRAMQENLDITAGQVLGQLFASGRFEPHDPTVYEASRTGDGATTTFDLNHDSVDPEKMDVTVGGAAEYDWSISRGTGTDGVDQIVFDAAPADTSAIEINYKRTTATPAGVLLEDTTTGAGEFPTMPVLVDGGALYDQLTGVPDGYAKGSTMGNVRLE